MDNVLILMRMKKCVGFDLSICEFKLNENDNAQ